MDFYVNKLCSLGIPACRATYIVADFVKTYHGIEELEAYIESLETDAAALAIDGEPILTSRAVVTPAAVDEYFNVTSTDIINVPCGCCLNVSVENVSEAPPGGVAPAINVQNANLTVTKIM